MLNQREYSEQIGRALRLLGQRLQPFAEHHLTVHLGSDWLDKVQLPPPKAEPARRGRIRKALETGSPIDPRELIKLIKDNWTLVFANALGFRERCTLVSLHEIGNAWAHSDVFEKTVTLQALVSIQALLESVGDSSSATEVSRLVDLVRGDDRMPPRTPETHYAPPYHVGPPVRNNAFYGRARLVGEIIDGSRDSVWILGARRVGKTSLLRRVEEIAIAANDGDFAVFWDLQGAEGVQDLTDSFHFALADARQKYDFSDLDLEQIHSLDVFGTLRWLLLELRKHERRLLLLCDETEELIAIREESGANLRKLKQIMQGGESIRTVLTSTIRLWRLSEETENTSPFLHGFVPPTYISVLRPEESRQLIRQDNLHSSRRPALGSQTIEFIRVHCGDHPFLTQMMCKAFAETDDLQQSLERLESDAMVADFFRHDYRMLPSEERRMLQDLADGSPSLQIEGTAGLQHRLLDLGYIRLDEDGQPRIANYFFERWIGSLGS